ncbi:hypothetical protein J437_LFUL015357 [Ladona fulva]|uniref:PiggyBac transposable element-derived protein domain-containing protein n=1 Tax=Ladona fulva TaxID=123851 RepID=A0A8K0KII9_LADFU|nr:hypothetical protein J437_LFUL015357 [Ladona fulva]
MKHAVCNTIINSVKKQNPTANDISRKVFSAKRFLQENDLLATKADEGQCVVVLNKNQYVAKCQRESANVTRLKSDPTNLFTSRLKKALLNVHIFSHKESYSLLPINPLPPCFFRLPKLHKPKQPIRPIVSSISAPRSQQREIYAGGTVRVNRFHSPPLISDKEIMKKERGSSSSVTSKGGDIVVVVFRFREDTVDRWDKKKEYVSIRRPEVIRLYNKSMGGVDLMDQMISMYRIFIKSRKWTLQMIMHAMDMALVNSWFEYRNYLNQKNFPDTKIIDLLEFKMNVAECLVRCKARIGIKRGIPSNEVFEEKNRRTSQIERRPLKEVRLDGVDHLPIVDKRKDGGCCKYGKCKGKSKFLCMKCNIHLCLNKERNCFLSFHTK